MPQTLPDIEAVKALKKGDIMNATVTIWPKWWEFWKKPRQIVRDFTCSVSQANNGGFNVSAEIDAANNGGVDFTQCYLSIREGETFIDMNRAPVISLCRYAIVPIEEYERLTEKVVKWREFVVKKGEKA